MRNHQFLLALLFLPQIFWAQTQQNFPIWDIRSDQWLGARVGAGYQFSNQNANFYLFAEADACVTCGIWRWAKPNQSVYERVNQNRFRANTHLRFSTMRDHKMYGTRFTNRSKRPEFQNKSWTYLTAAGLSFDFMAVKMSKIGDRESGNLNEKFFKKSQFRLRYDLISRYHSYYYRKLSNSVGYFNLVFRGLDDRWGAQLNWGNDVFIFTKKTIPNHDHGETNSFFVGGYVRPNSVGDLRGMPDAAPQYFLADVQKISMSFNVRMITDRNVMHRQIGNQARFGMYDVVGLRESFHGYWGIRTAVEGGFYQGHLWLGADDLILGRNLQRWAHQGNLHLSKTDLRDFLIKKSPASKTPLFPWEQQAIYYRKPRFYYELGIGGNFQTFD